MPPADLRKKVVPPAKAVGIATWTAGILSFAQMHCRLQPPAKREALFDRYVQRWAAGVLVGMRAQVRVCGEVAPLQGHARLVIANHRTAADIPVLMRLFGGSVLSRADLADWPLLGRAAKAAQTIFVDRESSGSRLRAIRNIRACLQRGRTVSLFPEGATFCGDEVRTFAPGALAALRGLDVEIVPVGLAYPPGTEFTQDSFLQHAHALGQVRHLPIGVCIGPTVPRCDHPKDPGQLAAMLQDTVQALVGRARTLIE